MSEPQPPAPPAPLLGLAFRKGPYAILASVFSSMGMYLATAYLVYDGRSADAGALRIFAAYLALTTILTLNQSAKIIVRHVVTGAADRLSRFLLDCALLSVTIALLSAGLLATGVHIGSHELQVIGVIGIISALTSGFDVSAPVLQAEGRLELLAAVNAAKYGVAAIVLVGALIAGVPAFASFCAYAVTAATIGIVASLVVVRPHLSTDVRRVIRTSSRSDMAQATRLTAANALPFSLEHIDKFIVRALFSEAVLGMYTLGFATGRFVYNHIAPVTLAFSAQLVRHRPSRSTLVLVFWSGLAIGIGCALALWLGTFLVPALAFFEPALPTAYVIFAAYGVAAVNTVMMQSAALHMLGDGRDMLAANLMSSIACLLLFALAPLAAQPLALLILAAHFPLRHAVSLAILRRRTRRAAAPASLGDSFAHRG